MLKIDVADVFAVVAVNTAASGGAVVAGAEGAVVAGAVAYAQVGSSLAEIVQTQVEPCLALLLGNAVFAKAARFVPRDSSHGLCFHAEPSLSPFLRVVDAIAVAAVVIAVEAVVIDAAAAAIAVAAVVVVVVRVS